MKRKISICLPGMAVLITMVFLGPNPGFSGFGDQWPAQYRSCGEILDSSLDECLSVSGSKHQALTGAHQKRFGNCQGDQRCLKKAEKAYIGGSKKIENERKKCDNQSFKAFIGCIKKAGTTQLKRGHRVKDVQKSIGSVRNAINDTIENCRHKAVFAEFQGSRFIDWEATAAAKKECYDALEKMIPKVLEAQLDQHFN